MPRKKKKSKSDRVKEEKRIAILNGDLDADSPSLIFTPQNPLIISPSRLRIWQRCRLQYHWKYNLHLQSSKPMKALYIGSLVHAILEAWYRKPRENRTIKMMIKVVRRLLKKTNPQELSPDDLELTRAMCIGYAEWAKPLDAQLKMRQVEPEKKFRFPLNEDGSILLQGIIDLPFLTHRKQVGTFFEFKTRGKFRDEFLDLNIQVSSYIWAMMQEIPGLSRYRAIRRELRKQLPTERVRAPLFKEVEIERDIEQINQWQRDTIRECHDMVRGGIYPRSQDSCEWDCDFKIPCLLRGDREAVAELLGRDFKPREYRP